VAVDPASGRLYAVWQDARFGGGQFDSIAFSQSLDGGLSWSAPIKVNQTPTNLPAGNQQAFTASVHVSANGTVGVSYYDFRNNTPAPAILETDDFLVHCHPTTPTACATASNWGDEVRVTTSSFNMRRAPDAGGFFTGDYEGLDNIGTAFTSFFSQPTEPTRPAPSSAESDRTDSTDWGEPRRTAAPVGQANPGHFDESTPTRLLAEGGTLGPTVRVNGPLRGRRTGGERAATGRQQPIRNDSKRRGQGRYRSIAAGPEMTMLVFTAMMPVVTAARV
jgi:hypothetical protein